MSKNVILVCESFRKFLQTSMETARQCHVQELKHGALFKNPFGCSEQFSLTALEPNAVFSSALRSATHVHMPVLGFSQASQGVPSPSWNHLQLVSQWSSGLICLSLHSAADWLTLPFPQDRHFERSQHGQMQALQSSRQCGFLVLIKNAQPIADTLKRQ